MTIPHPIKTFIVVPARSGSKGIPDKNIKTLANKPLIYWTALAVKLAKPEKALTILSTDSSEYAEIGHDYGLLAPFIRPQKYATDHSPGQEAAKHAINWFKNEFNYKPEQIMWLQPTSPFQSPELIKQALKLIDEKSVDSVIGCKKIYRDLTTLFEINNGYMKALSNEEIQTRRQDIPDLLTPNGTIYLTKTDTYLSENGNYPPKTLPLLMDTISSHDIDDEDDWKIAEAYINQKLSWIGKL